MRDRPRHTAAALALTLLLATGGCATEDKETCAGGWCSGPAHVTSVPDALQDALVAVLSMVAVVPIVPGSAGGPARIIREPGNLGQPGSTRTR